MNRLSAVTLCGALVLAGCTHWPTAGRGGEADRFAASRFYEPAATFHESQAALLTQLETLQSQLDVLSLQGAKQCIPASVRRLSLISHRVRRQIEGELLADAGHDLVIFQHELRFLRQQFLTVAQETGCHVSQPTVVTAAPVMFSVFFDVSSETLEPAFVEHIQWWVNNGDASYRWHLKGYADVQGDEVANEELAANRVNTVKTLLQEFGVSFDRISVDSHGEVSPVLTDTDAFSLGMNRRVDVFVQIDASNSDWKPVQTWESLGLKSHRHFWMGWE